jgi:hypothetical protein
MQWSYEQARKHSQKGSAKQKARYDRKVRGATLEVGDIVLIRAIASGKDYKIQDRWAAEKHCVVAVPHRGMPVYVVQPEDNPDAPTKTLHRNRLLPLEIADVIEDDEPQITEPTGTGEPEILEARRDQDLIETASLDHDGVLTPTKVIAQPEDLQVVPVKRRSSRTRTAVREPTWWPSYQLYGKGRHGQYPDWK